MHSIPKQLRISTWQFKSLWQWICILAGLSYSAALVPALQTMTPQSVYVSWIDSVSNTTSPIVKYGTDSTQLNKSQTGSTDTRASNHKYQAVQLTSLTPNTKYYYRVFNGIDSSQVFAFKTYPLPGQSSGVFRFLILGDNQILSQPRYETMIDSILVKMKSLYGNNWRDSIHMVLQVGDQVDVGTLEHYRNVHFGKIRKLSPYFAFQTAVGNHETYQDPSMANYRAHFFYDNLKYKSIPQPESELAYAFQAGPAVFLMLSSEHTTTAYLNFAKAVGDSVSKDTTVQWLFPVCHRPYQAEQYVGDISTWYRNTVIPALIPTQKLAVALGGHHHLYARGQLRNDPVYHVISGGTAWDQYWGQNKEQDFDDVQKTVSNWAWQLAELNPKTKRMEVRSYAVGHPKLGFVYSNRPIDQFALQKNTTPPQKPVLSQNLSAPVFLPLTLRTNAYVAGSDSLQASQFQFSIDTTFKQPTLDVYRDHENLYGTIGAPSYEEIDQNKNIDLMAFTLTKGSLANGKWFVRARHRDRLLNWSPWSNVKPFEITGSIQVQQGANASKNQYNLGEAIDIQYFGADTTTDWVGIYGLTQSPGSSSPSKIWSYVQAGNGSKTLANTLSKGRYFVSLFSKDGYTELGKRDTFYVGSIPELSTPKALLQTTDSIEIHWKKASALSKDWIGLYLAGTTPSAAIKSPAWEYITQDSGVIRLKPLADGFYIARYFQENGYETIGNSLEIQVGTTPAKLSLNKTTFAYGDSIIVNFAGGRANPKDYIGIFPSEAIIGKNDSDLVAYLYINGAAEGQAIFKGMEPFKPNESLKPGNYKIALFTNDSYTAISNLASFSITGITSTRQETNNQGKLDKNHWIHPDLKNLPYSLTDLQGRELKYGSISTTGSIDLSSLANGVYIIHVPEKLPGDRSREAKYRIIKK
jgi:hypothetical protein